MLQFDATFIVVLLSFIVFMLWMKAAYFEPVAAVKVARAKQLAMARMEAQTVSQQCAVQTDTLEASLKEARRKAQRIIEAARSAAKLQASNRVAQQKQTAQEDVSRQLGAINNHMIMVQSELHREQNQFISALLLKLLPQDVSARWGLVHGSSTNAVTEGV